MKKSRLIYCDTDSAFFGMKDFLTDYESKSGKKFKNDDERAAFLVKVGDKIVQPMIQKEINEIYDKLNVFKKTLTMAREEVCTKAIFCQKKKYIKYSKVIDNRTLDKPEVKVKGVEIVRTSTPQIIRTKLKDTVKYILDNTDEDALRKYVKEYKKGYNENTIEDIAFPRGVNGLKKYTKPGYSYGPSTPIHVRATILYNRMINKLKLQKKYPYIKNGEKIKYVYLQEPNPLKENVIAIPQGFKLPEEFGLHKYVDYNMMFDKSFMTPLTTIVKTLNWDLDKRKVKKTLF